MDWLIEDGDTMQKAKRPRHCAILLYPATLKSPSPDGLQSSLFFCQANLSDFCHSVTEECLDVRKSNSYFPQYHSLLL